MTRLKQTKLFQEQQEFRLESGELRTELLFDGWDYAPPDEYDATHKAKWKEQRKEIQRFLEEYGKLDPDLGV